MAAFDVAIVGAGPAGCLAACRLAARGARVALLDGSHPREKPCGGGVTGRALALVGSAVEPDRLDAVHIRGATFEYGGRRASVDIGESHPAGIPRLVVVARREFDGALLSAASAAGARLITERVTDVERASGRWRLGTRGRQIEAGWLLGADGPGSLVRRRVHRPFERRELSVASGYFAHGTTSREIEIAFERDPAGYLWSFPRRDHIAVGVCGQADRATSAALVAAAGRWIARHVTAANLSLERYSWPIPSLPAAAIPRNVVAGEAWMLLGDAAGLVDPITREGIFFALASGEAAADSLTDGRQAAARYAERIGDTIHAELERAARLKDWFFRPETSALLIAALARSGPVREVMADLVSGEQPYRGLRRRLLRTFEWRLMRDLVAAGGLPVT